MLFLDSNALYTGYSSMDWFHNSSSAGITGDLWLASCSTSSLHIFEVIVMFFGYYIHRHFPAEFSLSTELMLNLVLGWVIDWITNMTFALSPQGNENPCILGTLTIVAVLDLMRCFSFVLIIYIITMTSFKPFPLPFSWVFNDFTKFLFEPQCVRVFHKYLVKMEPNKVELMNKLMKIFLSDFVKNRESDASAELKKNQTISNTNTINFSYLGKTSEVFDNTRLIYLDAIAKLEPSFKQFKKTRSAQTLYESLKEFEEITERASN